MFNFNNVSHGYLKKLGAKNIKYIGNLKYTQSEQKLLGIDRNTKKFLNQKNLVCFEALILMRKILWLNSQKIKEKV